MLALVRALENTCGASLEWIIEVRCLEIGQYTVVELELQGHISTFMKVGPWQYKTELWIAGSLMLTSLGPTRTIGPIEISVMLLI